MLTANPQAKLNRTNRTAARAALLLLLGAAFAVASVVLPGLGLGPGLSLAPAPPPAVQAHAITSVNAVSITSTPAADGIYRTGEAITVRVTFPNCVTNVSQTSAALTITLDSGNVSAPLINRASFTPSNVLNYSYTVAAADSDGNGIVIPTNALVGTYNVRSGAGCGSGGHSSGHTYTLPNTYTTAQSAHLVNGRYIDYDTDDDGYIEIRTLQQLNAIRWDPNGNGDPNGTTNDAAFLLAFPDGNITTLPHMGCRSQGCRGYELAADLNFDTNRDGVVNSSDTNTYTDWVAIPSESSGSNYTTRFEGNGYIIANLTQSTSSASGGGLFRGLSGSSAVVRNVGLVNISVTSTATSDAILGGLVSQMASGAVVEYSYIRDGTVTVAAGGGASNAPIAGGLIGRMNGSTVRYSYADVTVTQPTGSDAASRMGGLVGLVENGSNVNYCYAHGNVQGGRGTHTAGGIGGLVGRITGTANSFVTYSYAVGTITFGTSGVSHGGLVGSRSSANAFVTNSYFSREIEASTGGGGISRTTSQLRTGQNTYSGFGSGWDYGDSDEYPARTFSYSSGDSGARQSRALNLQRADVDYDTDGDGLVEVKNLDQLNAIRFDLNGNGQGDTAALRPQHTLAFHGFDPGSCPDNDMPADGASYDCEGYELANDLDFAGSTVYANWLPIGGSGSYSATFHGRGFTISNLTITSTNVYRQGLFSHLNAARVEQLGLPQATITATNNINRWISAGPLAGASQESVIRSAYATGRVTATTTGSHSHEILAGGLVGELLAGSSANPSQIVASWADVDVTTTSSSNSANPDRAGGLVGGVTTGSPTPSIRASYAAGDVAMSRASGTGTRCAAGGLAGRVGVSAIVASYSTGRPSCNAGTGTAQVGGLIGLTNPANAAGHTHANSYWDTDASGQTTSAGGANVTGKTTAELQFSPATAYLTGSDFDDWNQNVDGVSGNDDPWDFGVTGHYPILKFGFTANDNFGQRMQRSPYDTDGDNLLEIGGAGATNRQGLDQLNAIRYDLTGGGDTFAMSADDRTAYRAAFPNQLRCGHSGCAGYELAADLDFDTGTAGDRTDDAYYNGGAGWTPLGPGAGAAAYTAAFDGNGRTIANLLINATDVVNVGLFGWANGGPIKNVGLTDVDLTANYAGGNATYTFSAGAVAGTFTGDLHSSYATGSVAMAVTDTGAQSASRGGGLVGGTFGATTIGASYAATSVTLTSTSTSGQFDNVGGLVGVLGNTGAVIAAYATGAVSADRDSAAVGGLIGLTGAATAITASYATGTATAAGSTPMVGGLIGNPANTPTVTASYWDTATSNIADDIDNDAPEGLTTSALKTPRGYAAGSIYAAWNVNVDGDADTGDAAGNDDPWLFAGPDYYPILQYGPMSASYALQLGATIDYDTDDDGLIDVSNLHQLNAIRWDGDGNGAPPTAGAARENYARAYPAPVADLGCPTPAGCAGYELLNDLDFDTDGSDRIADAPYAEWTPLPNYSATFDGKGHTIANLNVNVSSGQAYNAGLFAELSVWTDPTDPTNTSTGVIRSLGLLDPTINADATLAVLAGALVGLNFSGAQIYAVYVNGGSVTAMAPNVSAGGLVGRHNGVGTRISASYVRDVPVDVSGSGGARQYAGGLVGHLREGANITASYAASTVANTGTSTDTQVGGLVGFTDTTGAIAPTVTNSYYDNSVEDDAAVTDATAGQTTTALTTPTAYDGIYATWNTYDIDNADGDDDLTTNTAGADVEPATGDAPWDFGNALQYPILTFGFDEAGIMRQRLALTFTDYDSDDDGLIEVDSLAKLHAIRYDLNGDGRPNMNDAAAADGHARGYPNFISDSCPDDDDPADGASFDCRGYELTSDLDFDENGDGTVDALDWGGLYHNSNAGWLGIGTSTSAAYDAVFDGNGHTIANLYINRSGVPGDNQGLFRFTGANSRIVGVGLPDVNVTGEYTVGALAGRADGPVTSCWVTGAVNARHSAGMLVGEQRGRLAASWSDGQITMSPSGDAGPDAGGLVGASYAEIIASYSHVGITGALIVGGLVGDAENGSAIIASYAAGRLTNIGAEANIAGLAGLDDGASPATAYTDSWFDQHATTADVREYQHGTATDQRATTTDLIATDDYTAGGIFENWNVDVDDADGDGDRTTNTAAGEDAAGDAPWDFGDALQYPILTFGHSADSIARQKAAFALLDYDTDDDGLIEVDSLAKLNAIRYDVNGDGLLTGRGAAGRNDANRYAAAYPRLSSTSCPDGDDADSAASHDCHGYELTMDLDFDENGDGMVDADDWDGAYHRNGAGWAPIPSYAATFDGNGNAISNLTIVRNQSGGDWVGLFSGLNSAAGVIRSVGLLNPAVTAMGSGSPNWVGTLVGNVESGAQIYACYVQGGSVTATTASTMAGGLVGRMTNTGTRLLASYAVDIAVSIDDSSATYRYAGGLVGLNNDTANITASYAVGTVSNSGSGGDARTGSLVAYNTNNATVTDSYYDSTVSSFAGGGGAGHGTGALTAPTDYGTEPTDLYRNWNVNVDGDTGTGDADGNDDPWNFGDALQYPLLKYARGADDIARQRRVLTFTDYDTDDDGLIEVDTLVKLNAIRYDLDGNGQVSDANAASYAVAYPRLTAGSCPDGDDMDSDANYDCRGYELTADLDFDTDSSGVIDVDDGVLSWGAGTQAGFGWTPIGVDSQANCASVCWNGEFHGNGHLISNLFINRSGGGIGLFGGLGANALITGVGLHGVDITGGSHVGAVSGASRGGAIAAVWSSGTLSAVMQNVGGLVGNFRASSTLTASYSTATITAGSDAGGLVGYIDSSTIRYSYAAGTVPSGGGGLFGGGTTTPDASYWDANIVSGGGTTANETTANLQGTIGYTGIYEDWNVDVDNADGDDMHDTNTAMGENTAGDDPWDFVAAYQYPILKWGGQASSRAAQLTPQDATLRAVARPANVDRLRQTGATDYLLEVDQAVTMVALPAALFTPTQAGSTVAAPTTPDTSAASVDGDVVTLAPGEPPTLATIRVTAPSGRAVLAYTLTIQRIFCPKASLTGPSDVVGEGGVAEFTVLVCGKTEGPVTATWSAAGAAFGGAMAAEAGDLGNAANTAPLAEFPAGQTITVPAGEDRTATIRIPIFDDAMPEGAESFTVTLTGVSGGTDRYDDNAPETATIELSDPTLTLLAPEGTGAGGAGDGAGSDTPLTASSRLILMEGAANAYTMQMQADPGGQITIVIHSNHDGVTTTPDRVTFTGGPGGNWQTPQRVTVNAAPDGDDNNESATLTHILTDAAGGLIEIIDQLPLFVADTDPPEDDDIC